MNKLVTETKHYLNETLNLSLQINRWKGDQTLPLMFQNNYEFYRSNILNQEVLFITPKGHELLTPSVLSKHHSMLSKKFGMSIVFLSLSLSSYMRKNLIEKKISFIVPGNQLYLPEFGMDLREHIINQRITRGSCMSIVSQIALFYIFYDRSERGFSATFLAEELGYSIMSLSRALRELAEIGLGQLVKEGTSKLFFIGNDIKKLWNKALPYLRSPVKKRLYIDSPIEDKKMFPSSGLTALSNKTLLNAPKSPVIAMTNIDWKMIQSIKDIKIIPMKEEGCTEVEIWHYNPILFSTDKQVDILSLYLSLQDSSDERIQSALDSLMEDFKW